MIKDLLRLFPFARHRVDMSKAGPCLSYASKRYCLFKRSNGLWESPLLFMRPAQKIVIEPIIRIEIDGCTQLLDRLVPLIIMLSLGPVPGTTGTHDLGFL